MAASLEIAIDRIRDIADQHCENQMYCWPGFNSEVHDPASFFRSRNIDFDGELFVRYQVKQTFGPLSVEQIHDGERAIGATLPNDYKSLLQHFGEFHLPGNAGIQIESPTNALNSTRCAWLPNDTPIRALAISPYNQTSDGNSIGFVLDGNSFSPALFEFDHELRYKGDDPSLWTRKLGDSLAEFLVSYLERSVLS